MANARTRRTRRIRPPAPRDAVEATPVQPPVPLPDEVDAVVHERTRLAIVAALATRESMSFTELRSALRTTDGNVSAHTRKLEEAGYIVTRKRFEGRVPRTEYSLTESGRRALNAYLAQMERLIGSMRPS
ncbi:MAG TPA: transcriptional regulator [Dehalococcoidia bacterium]|nr:transcriptional regulator [Dehalococcoidia bacterium]